MVACWLPRIVTVTVCGVAAPRVAVLPPSADRKRRRPMVKLAPEPVAAVWFRYAAEPWPSGTTPAPRRVPPRNCSWEPLADKSITPAARVTPLSALLVLLLASRWARSEEGRVGKECRSRWSAYH